LFNLWWGRDGVLSSDRTVLPQKRETPPERRGVRETQKEKRRVEVGVNSQAFAFGEMCDGIIRPLIQRPHPHDVGKLPGGERKQPR